MKRFVRAARMWSWLTAMLPCLAVLQLNGVEAKPYAEGRFRGRIAYSADGNHNDPDDWIASPMTLAILAQVGLKDRLIHFDYNSILPQTNPAWEKTHAESVLGAAERHGFDKSRFIDCRKNLEAALASIAQAINDCSKENPLFFLLAGPMEVPHRRILKSDPTKRQFVYCISHSRWNDEFASNYPLAFTQRSVIELEVRWVQIRDQNRLLSFGRYGRPAPSVEFAPYLWMRDSPDAKVRWLWERMLVSTRPDPSDAGMTYFLVTADEECQPAKLRRLLEAHEPPPTTTVRKQVRVEAENFRRLDGFVIEDRKDRDASHELSIRLDRRASGSIRTRFVEPFTPAVGRYDVQIRFFDEPGHRCRLAFFVNGVARGAGWESAGDGRGWTSHTVRGVEVRVGDELRVDAEGPESRLDYVQLDYLSYGDPPEHRRDADSPGGAPGPETK